MGPWVESRPSPPRNRRTVTHGSMAAGAKFEGGWWLASIFGACVPRWSLALGWCSRPRVREQAPIAHVRLSPPQDGGKYAQREDAQDFRTSAVREVLVRHSLIRHFAAVELSLTALVEGNSRREMDASGLSSAVHLACANRIWDGDDLAAWENALQLRNMILHLDSRCLPVERIEDAVQDLSNAGQRLMTYVEDLQLQGNESVDQVDNRSIRGRHLRLVASVR